MKKLITIALILCTLAITVVTCFAYEIITFPNGLDAIKNQIEAFSNEKIEYQLCEDGFYDFCGIKVVEVEEIHYKLTDTYGYVITFQDGEDVFEICEDLETTGSFTYVEPAYIMYPADEPTATLGDINMNGELDARDYVLAKRAYFGTAAISDEAKALADVNQNGELDARDYVLIKRVYFGTATFGEANATDDEISA